MKKNIFLIVLFIYPLIALSQNNLSENTKTIIELFKEMLALQNSNSNMYLVAYESKYLGTKNRFNSIEVDTQQLKRDRSLTFLYMCKFYIIRNQIYGDNYCKERNRSLEYLRAAKLEYDRACNNAPNPQEVKRFFTLNNLTGDLLSGLQTNGSGLCSNPSLWSSYPTKQDYVSIEENIVNRVIDSLKDGYKRIEANVTDTVKLSATLSIIDKDEKLRFAVLREAYPLYAICKAHYIYHLYDTEFCTISKVGINLIDSALSFLKTKNMILPCTNTIDERLRITIKKYTTITLDENRLKNKRKKIEDRINRIDCSTNNNPMLKNDERMGDNTKKLQNIMDSLKRTLNAQYNIDIPSSNTSDTAKIKEDIANAHKTLIYMDSINNVRYSLLNNLKRLGLNPDIDLSKKDSTTIKNDINKLGYLQDKIMNELAQNEVEKLKNEYIEKARLWNNYIGKDDFPKRVEEVNNLGQTVMLLKKLTTFKKKTRFNVEYILSEVEDEVDTKVVSLDYFKDVVKNNYIWNSTTPIGFVLVLEDSMNDIKFKDIIDVYNTQDEAIRDIILVNLKDINRHNLGEPLYSLNEDSVVPIKKLIIYNLAGLGFIPANTIDFIFDDIQYLDIYTKHTKDNN